MPETTSSNAILILTDVIGHDSINAQLIADQFAANGYLTLMPDLFHGDAVPLNRPGDFDIQAWRTKHPTSDVDAIISSIIHEMKTTHHIHRIGAVGYCFGGKYVARFLAPGQGVDVGFTAHPSFMDAAELRGIRGPLSIAAAETDHIFPAAKRRETEDILQGLDVPYQVTLYSGVQHGFATRADLRDRRQRFAKERAFEQAVVWFEEYLRGGGQEWWLPGLSVED